MITNSLTTLFSVEHKLVYKANVRASLNSMSAIVPNIIQNVNMLHLHMTFQYLYECICLHDHNNSHG